MCESHLDASEELSRILSEEIAKGIDSEILSMLGVVDKRVHRRNKIEELWSKELM
jgi:hypothetical protein